MSTAAIFRRPHAKQKRAANAAERRSYIKSFSYEDDKAAAAAAPGTTMVAESAAGSAQVAPVESKDRRDKRR